MQSENENAKKSLKLQFKLLRMKLKIQSKKPHKSKRSQTKLAREKSVL